MKSIKGICIISSITPMSLVNRLRILPVKNRLLMLCIHLIICIIYLLPDVFVLKKCIVAFVIVLNIMLCKFMDVLVKNDTNNKLLMIMTTKIIKFMTA